MILVILLIILIVIVIYVSQTKEQFDIFPTYIGQEYSDNPEENDYYPDITSHIEYSPPVYYTDDSPQQFHYHDYLYWPYQYEG